MKPTPFRCKLLFIFLLGLNLGLSFHWEGNILYDLEANTVADMTTEAALWTLSSYVSPGNKVYKCGTYVLLGGYNILGGSGMTGSNPYYGQYFSRTYNSLPIHNQIYIQILFYAIDSWDGGTDHFSIAIDIDTIFGWTLDKQPAYSSTVCGKTGDPEIPPFTAFVSYAHSASSLTLKIINYADEASNNESLGFRDIKIEFLTSSSPYSSLCSASSAPLETTTSCGSSCTGSDLSMNPPGSGICSPTSCSSSCKTCSGSSVTCGTCKTGEFMVGSSCYSDCSDPYLPVVLGGITYCTTPCPGNFVWWDKSCETACSYSTGFSTFSMKGNTISTFSRCDFPCGANQYLFWNTSCFDSCPEPLINLIYKGKNLCEFGCTSSQYLYWNGSCKATCELPLVSEVQSGRKFCWYPCQNNEFLYWNGSCVSSCPEPLSWELRVDRKFCWYKCQPSEYLYWNGSCESTCESPLSSEIQGVQEPRRFCWYPCSEAQYLYWNGSCIDKCDSPLSMEIQSGRRFCWYGCQPTEYLYWNGSCEGSCESPLRSEIQGVQEPRNFCWYPCQNNEFLYWNGSCVSSCPEPLSWELRVDRKFCWYKCQPSEYLYWNGSCESSCDPPLSSDIQGIQEPRNFCWYPCQDNEFLYWNGSCVGTCPTPLTIEFQGPRKFCRYECQPNEYLYWNGSCLDSCSQPLALDIQGTTEARNFCWYPCQDNEYLYWNASCIASCPPLFLTEIQVDRKFCWYPCQPDEFLYWNGSCKASCSQPLALEVQDTSNFCWYPCQQNEFLYWNGSCLAKCDSPFALEIQDTRNFCWYPCQQNEFLYWNGSCLSQCEYPLQKKLEQNYQFCTNPCEGMFLYPNQACFSTCPSPLKILSSPGVQYCVNPCGISGDYLYENQTCLNTCSSPYLKRTEPVGIKYCDRPCSSPNIFRYQNDSCLAACEFPYVQTIYDGIVQCLPPCKRFEYFNKDEKTCYSTCKFPYKIAYMDVIKICRTDVSLSKQEIEKMKEEAAKAKLQGKIGSASMQVASLVSSSNPSSALLAGLSSMMLYIRYMKINFPPKVQMLFKVTASEPFSLGYGVKIPSFIKENLSDNPLPYSFNKYDITSNFVENLWDFMVSLALQLLAILALTIVKKITAQYQKINRFLGKVLQALKWNFPIMMICASSGDIFFFASLQLRSSPFTDLSSTVCCIVSILMMILVILLLAAAFKIAYRIARWKGFEILYADFEERSFFSLAYMFLFLMRSIIFNLTLATLFEYPLVECIIINGCNVAMICYVIYVRPLKDIFALVQVWINEALLNALSICVLILAILDYLGVEQQKTRIGMGDVMLIVIKSFNFVALAFMAIGGLIFMKSVYKTWKTRKSKDMRSPLQILNFLFFGDEERGDVEVGKGKNCPDIEKDFRESNQSTICLKNDGSLGNLFCDTSIIKESSPESEFKKEKIIDFEMNFHEEKPDLAERRKRRVRVKRKSNILASEKEETKNHPASKNKDAEDELWFSKYRKLKARLNLNSKKSESKIETNINLY